MKGFYSLEGVTRPLLLYAVRLQGQCYGQFTFIKCECESENDVPTREGRLFIWKLIVCKDANNIDFKHQRKVSPTQSLGVNRP